MAFFLYIAIVLVSISSILLELDWLTKPKLEQPVPVTQNTTTRPVPVPQAPRQTAQANGASQDLSPAPRKVETTGSAPANETANPSPLPAAQQPEPPAPAPAQQQAVAPAPQQQANASPSMQPNAPSLPPAGNATSAPAPAPAHPPQPVATANAAPAAEPAARAQTPPPVALATQSAVNAPKTCDVQACSARYQSFRSADCTYQPAQGGERRVCTKRGNGNVARAPMQIRPDRDAELREVERAVRQLPRSDDRAELRRPLRPADDDGDDYDAPRPPGRVPLFGRRWP
jgi:BA14K-like protein